MGMTLNIIARECERLGQVVRFQDSNPVFEGVRYYLPGRALRPDTLYVCERASDARSVAEAGCHAVLVSSEPPVAQAPDAQAALLLTSAETALSVLDALLDAHRRYSEWERQMDALYFEQQPIQQLLDISEPFLKNHVVVLDSALKLLAYTRGVPCDDPITVELIGHGYHTEENIRKFKLHRRFKPWSESDGFVVNDTHAICKYVTVARSVRSRSAFTAISVMMCNVEDESPWLLDVFKLFCDRVERYALRDYPDGKPTGNAVDLFLKDLLSGSIESADAVVERSRFAGIPNDARFCLFYMEAGKDSVPASRLLTDVAMSVAPAKTLLVDEGVAVLCFNCKSDACALHCMPHACPLGKRTVSQRISAIMDRHGLVCGRSSKFTALSDAPRAYRQARAAYAVGSRVAEKQSVTSPDNAWPRIFSFDARCIDYLAGNLSEEAAGLLDLTYAGSLLSTLERTDVEAKTNNYDFLYAYLLHERRVTVVAEKLHMHRNNVNYRIRRIEEQFNIDTDDPMLRQDLLFAYRLREALRRQCEGEKARGGKAQAR